MNVASVNLCSHFSVSGAVIRHTENFVSVQFRGSIRCGAEERDFEVFHAIGSDGFEHAVFDHGGNARLPQELAEDFGKLLFGIVICSDVQNHRMIGGVIQEGFIAFIGFKNTEFSVAGRVVSGKFIADEVLGESARNERGCGAETVQRFREPGGHRRFAAASGHRENRRGELFDEQAHRFGAVQACGSLRSTEKVGVVLLNCGRVHKCGGRGQIGITGTVLRIETHTLCTERIDDASVFGRIERAVAARCFAAEHRRHLRERAHADSADADKMKRFRQLFHDRLSFLRKE